VRRAATTLLSGLVVGSLFEQEKVFDVVVWGTPQTRSSLTSVRNLLIDTPEGGHVRLGSVASVRIAPSPDIIKRQAVSRYVDVSAAVSGRDRDAVVHDVQRSLRTLSFPIEYHAEVLAADSQPVWRLISIAIAALVGIFLLLQAFFGSWRLATLSIAATVAAGEKLSFGSYIALFAVGGLALRSGVLLFDRFRELEQDERDASGEEVVLRGAHDRLAPVVTTGALAGVVFLTILVMDSRPGLELLHPLALVVVGGLVTSVPYTLLVLPILYLRFGFGLAPAVARDEPAPVPVGTAEPAAGAGFAGEVPAGGMAVTETRALPPKGRP
jgi:Cu/Ag efflux pump CusA